MFVAKGFEQQAAFVLAFFSVQASTSTSGLQAQWPGVLAWQQSKRITWFCFLVHLIETNLAPR